MDIHGGGIHCVIFICVYGKIVSDSVEWSNICLNKASIKVWERLDFTNLPSTNFVIDNSISVFSEELWCTSTNMTWCCGHTPNSLLCLSWGQGLLEEVSTWITNYSVAGEDFQEIYEICKLGATVGQKKQ